MCDKDKNEHTVIFGKTRDGMGIGMAFILEHQIALSLISGKYKIIAVGFQEFKEIHGKENLILTLEPQTGGD